MSMKLTDRQKEVLAFVKSYMKTSGMPPSRKEIAAHFKFKSPAAAQDHLVKLAKNGAIRLIPNISRGIVVL